MTPSISITLDGLLRALRWKGHELAEQAEHYKRPRIRAVGLPPARRTVPVARGGDHDRRR